MFLYLQLVYTVGAIFGRERSFAGFEPKIPL
jgi:hypothetical protein